VNEAALRAQEVTLLDLLDRVIDHGVVLAGDVTLSVADVDLVYLGLRVLLAPVERMPELMSREKQEDEREVVCG
jgi:gas vesicle structural protein